MTLPGDGNCEFDCDVAGEVTEEVGVAARAASTCFRPNVLLSDRRRSWRIIVVDEGSLSLLRRHSIFPWSKRVYVTAGLSLVCLNTFGLR